MLTRGSNPKWFFNKLDGTILQPPATISFLENSLPYIPQNVFQDVDRLVPWSQPINIDSAGSIPDNIYLEPNLAYRIEVREGPGQTDPLVFPPIENYIVGGDGLPDNAASSGKTDNQITNPQFSLVNFTNGTTITTAGTYNIAPGWFLLLSGTGTTTLNQTPFAGKEGFDNNPPYALKIQNAGWSQAVLYQQFSNGALFSKSAVSFSALMQAVTYITPITVNFVDSIGTVTTLIDAENLAFEFTTYPGSMAVPDSINTDVPPAGFTKLQFILPGNGTVLISNVQLIGSAKAVPYAYEETTPERQIDQTFHVYKNELLIRPKDTILTGWDFSLNPWQFSPTAQTTIATQCQYICDNTVLYQKTSADNLQVYRVGNTFPPDTMTALQINPTSTAGVGATQFALITYVDAKTVAPYWGQYVSSLIRAQMTTPRNTALTLKMRILTRSSAVPLLSSSEPIASWTDKDPTFSLGWNVITPSNDPEYTVPSSLNDAMAFNEFKLPTQLTALDNIAIVLYTTSALVPDATTPDVFVIQRGSLVPNRFAVDSTPITFEENLKRCQVFYEKSYDYATLPGTLTTVNSCFHNLPVYTLSNGNYAAFINSFQLRFKTIKRTRLSSTDITFYSPTLADTTTPTNAAAGVLDVGLYSNSVMIGTMGYPQITNWIVETDGSNVMQSNESLIYQCHNTTGVILEGNNGLGQEAFLTFHYVADARVGVKV